MLHSNHKISFSLAMNLTCKYICLVVFQFFLFYCFKFCIDEDSLPKCGKRIIQIQQNICLCTHWLRYVNNKINTLEHKYAVITCCECMTVVFFFVSLFFVNGEMLYMCTIELHSFGLPCERC